MKEFIQKIIKCFKGVPKVEKESLPPSEEFEDAAIIGGGIYDTCSCGITHFTTNADFDYEEGELEDLKVRAEKNPELYIGYYDGSSVYTTRIGGEILVVGCLCNRLRRYEDFIWHHRYIIAKYLTKRNARESAQAASDEKDIAGLKDLV